MCFIFVGEMASESQLKSFLALFKFCSMFVCIYLLKQQFERITWFIMIKPSANALEKQISRTTVGLFSVSFMISSLHVTFLLKHERRS